MSGLISSVLDDLVVREVVARAAARRGAERFRVLATGAMFGTLFTPFG